MKIVEYEQVVFAVRHLCEQICHELAPDMTESLQEALHSETNPRAARIISQLLENARIARTDLIPLCQDSGLAIVFVEQGTMVKFAPPGENQGATIDDAINQGVAMGYKNAYLRNSVVAEPLHDRRNTCSNTPAIIHHSISPGSALTITIMAKGGGCENKSQFKMFNPTDTKALIADWIIDVVSQAGANACPPFVIGIGMGGDFEQCCLLSKKSLLRKLNTPNPDSFYAEIEKDLLKRVNSLGLGPQGLGGDTTALAVHIETGPCHIASLPVAVNIECHAHRHKSITL